ncbi:MAG TPA: alpha/beta fold hydrolase [Pseudonocardiaceae bacterium]|jgi:pimeloyl-ACP methyl ester carboxylesterase|nr:alpha/beta fold hydrolase [Pseudonocardiaceae bacterium]
MESRGIDVPSRPGHRAWRRYSRRIGIGLVAALAPVLVAACTVGPSATPSLVVAGSAPSTPSSTGKAPVPLPGLEKPSPAQVGWSDCTAETAQRLGTPAPPVGMTFQCSRLIAPIDPSGATDEGGQRIALLKVGTGPTPLLVVNDLDGLPGTLYAARLAATLPPQFLSTFSLIGMDRRGTAGSGGVHCIPQADRNLMLQADPSNTNLTALLSAATDASQQCVLALSASMANYNTRNTVADLEQVRQNLGINHLDAIGHGEGSRVLTTYADQYPTHVGRFVLDGSPDPQLSNQDTAQAQSLGAQATFAAFAQNCAVTNCPLGGDPTGAVNELLANVRGAPLAADGVQLTAGIVLRAILIGLADRSQWTALATDIQQALTGDGSGLAGLIDPVLTGTPQDPPQIDANLVAGCNDVTDRLSPGQVGNDIKAWSGKAPLFGGLYAQNLLLCGPWPVPTQPLPKPTAPNTPPILVISTASDPSTPETGTQRTAQSLDSGVLLTWAGAGHGALGQSSCATSAAQNFLIGGKVPAEGTACPP